MFIQKLITYVRIHKRSAAYTILESHEMSYGDIQAIAVFE